MKNTKKFFEIFDFFGQEVEFNINGKNSVKTVIGGLLGLALIGMIIASAWTLGKDIIYHEQPALVVQDLIEAKRPSLTLDAYSFPISIVIQDMPSNAVFYNPRYFTMAVELREVDNGKGTMKTTAYELEKCEKHHFPTISNDTFYSSGVNNYICIKDQNITISGYWDEPTMTFLMIRLLYCHDDPSCASKEEIDKWLMKSKFTWNIYCLSSLIDTTNFETPTQFYILNLYRMTQVYVSKVHEIYLQTLSSFTDMGIIFEDFKESTSIAFDFEKSDSTNEVIDKSLYDFYVFPSNKKTVVRRRYVKAQALAANLGGIIKFLMIVAKLLSFVFNKHKLNCILINNNIDIHVGSQNKYKNSKIPSRLIPTESLAPSFSLPQYSKSKNRLRGSNSLSKLPQPTVNNSPIKTNSRSSSLGIDTEVKMKLQKSKNYGKKMILSFSFVEVLKKYLCPSKVSIKKKVYEECEPLINQELDILNILSKLDDVQKLKVTLFEKEQLTLFGCMAKMEYGIDSEMSKMRKFLTKDKMSMVDKVNQIRSRQINDADLEKESINSRLEKYLSSEFY
jgi:hypothetical protein